MINVITLLGGVRATIFAGIAVVALAFSGVQTYRLDSAQDKIVEMKLAESEAHAAYQRELRKMETEMLEGIRLAEIKSLKEQRNAKENHDRAVARIRAGELRERFSCPRVPDDTGTTPGIDGEERRGLLEEDAEFLVSEAHRADLITIERNELIDIVKMLREQLNER